MRGEDALVRVRAARADEWRDLRDIRLRALAEAPYAFGSSLAQERDRPDEFWLARSQPSAERQTFVAEDAGRLVGIVTVVPRPPTEGHVFGMWVSPEARRRGVGRALVDAALEHARSVGVPRLLLGVTDGNDAARLLYERMGFRPTGRREPLARDPNVTEIEMAREL